MMKNASRRPEGGNPLPSTNVVIGRSARSTPGLEAGLAKAAEAVAATICVPPGIEFARFEHRGETYALSARVGVVVERLSARVPDVVVREGEQVNGRIRRGKRAGGA